MGALSGGAILTIDLGALADNWRTLRDRSGGAECAAVVKADAYGLGIEPAAAALAAAGCRTFFVAHLSEARRVRHACADATIYVLNGLLPGSEGAFLPDGIRPVLGSPEEIVDWAAFCRAQGKRLPAAIHIDTGMNRLGLPVADAFDLAADPILADFKPALLMSHLVAAEDTANPVTARQVADFERVRGAFLGVPASLANSSGILHDGVPGYDLVRAGFALYGGNPTPGRDNPMGPVVRLEAGIVQLRDVSDGEAVGYNGTWTARGPRRLATLSIGYADGYSRAASVTDSDGGTPRGQAIVAGRRCPFAGRVSMDLIILDVTDVPRDAVKRGDRAVLIGDDLTIDEVGARAGTIGYEVLTSLGKRYDRRYVGG
ncbi:alanine racemase [Salinarimonas soli]|uniref:Alanine racemase n=1 Tax=Salinarimonas soli TaxID=1638099 RepID=A0A5B2VF77_9HYPH|nr:alanine racemase [Salinarimonas soli]KAA2237771.1 alanine racemase [Salinarimonas soli]